MNHSSIDCSYNCSASLTLLPTLKLFTAGTPLGDKAFEVAEQVATDNAAELKREAAEMDTDALKELDWLETPVPEPSPSPVPIEIPPTPQPSPPPKLDFQISPDERRMRKAKGT